MEVTEARCGHITTLRIVGRVDSSVSRLLEQKVLDVVTRDDRIVVDVQEMKYVSSAGLRSFVALARHARAKGRTIGLTGMHEDVIEIFEISGLLSLFVVYDSVEAAVASP